MSHHLRLIKRGLANFKELTASIPPKGAVRLTYPSPKIAKISLDSASTRNALSPSMMCDFADIVSDLTAAPPNYIILTGANNTFCSGADIGVAASSLMSSNGGVSMSELMNATTTAIKDLSSISLAALDGAAYGGGAELATCTDFRVVREDVRVRFVQSVMGVTTGWGGGRRLANIVGEKKALRLLLLSETVDADSASQLGLADFVTPSNSSDYTLDLIERLRTPDELIHSLKPVVMSETSEEEISE